MYLVNMHLLVDMFSIGQLLYQLNLVFLSSDLNGNIQFYKLIHHLENLETFKDNDVNVTTNVARFICY